MIRYALVCSNEHVFEEWFSSGCDFDTQAEAGELTCPDCGDRNIRKTIMAPNIGKAAKPDTACKAAAPACASGGCPMAAGL